MPAEWQARQLSLPTSAPGPSGNMRSPAGRSTLTDFSVNLSAAGVASATRATARMIGSILRTIFSFSRDHNGGLLDDVAHEPCRVPVWRVRLRFAAAIGASDHQPVISRVRQAEADLPLPEAVFTFVGAQMRFLPALAAVAGELDSGYADIAAEGDAASEGRGAGRPTYVRKIKVFEDLCSWRSLIGRYY